MQLIMENWRNYAVNVEKEFRLINEINMRAYDTYGFQPSEFLSYQEQVYIINELGSDANNNDTMHAMIVCGLMRNKGDEENALNEDIMTALLTFRGAWFGVKALNQLVQWVIKKLGMKGTAKDLEKFKKDPGLARACQAKYFPGGVQPLDEQPVKPPALPPLYVKCINLEDPLPPEIEALKESIILKATKFVETTFATIERKLKGLLAYIGAVIKFRTLKPSDEQKREASYITEKILLYVFAGISLYLLGLMALTGGWAGIVGAAILIPLSAFGKKMKLKTINTAQIRGWSVEETPAKLKAEIEKTQKAAAAAIVDERKEKEAA